LWACLDPRPRLGYCVVARELIPAGAFVFEYCGRYLTQDELDALEDEEAEEHAAHGSKRARRHR